MKNKFLKKWRNATYGLIAVITSITFLSLPVAASVTDSTLFSGTLKLAQDLTTWLVGAAAVLGTVFIVYFLIRRSMADEMDQMKYEKRAKTAIISTILAVSITGLITLVLRYYQ